MMRKVLNFFIYVTLFLIAFMVFLPKESLYNLLEKELEKKQIVISDEKRDEKIFALDVSNANIYFERINIGKFDELSISSYLFFTKIDLNNVSFLDTFSSFIPSPITNISLKHSIFNFNKVDISSDGAFGKLSGEFNIFTNSVRLELIPSKTMKDSYSKLLKSMKYENERYIYEYKF